MTPKTYAIACKVTGPLPSKDGTLDPLPQESLDKAVEICRSELGKAGVSLDTVQLFITPPRYEEGVTGVPTSYFYPDLPPKDYEPDEEELSTAGFWSECNRWTVAMKGAKQL